MSSAYVDNDMRNEFGRLPAAFLPLCKGRVYELLLETYGDLGRCYMSIPVDFELPAFDAQRLESLGVTLLRIDPTLSVTEALARILSQIHSDNGLRILFGDTFVQVADCDLLRQDVVAVSQTETNHIWTFFDEGDGFSPNLPQDCQQAMAVCGYFSFSDVSKLRLALEDGGGVSGFLNHYDHSVGLTRLRPTEWLDLGHLTNYYRSRKHLLVSRAFNSIEVEGEVLRKKSFGHDKLLAEAEWYRNLPPRLSLHAPRYLGCELGKDQVATWYEVEYLYMPSFSDLFTFGNLPAQTWRKLFRASGDLLSAMGDVKPAQLFSVADCREFHEDLYERKTRTRLASFLRQHSYEDEQSFQIDGIAYPSLWDVVETVLPALKPVVPEQISFWHGDFFFGNMLYDTRAERVMLVDPRGLVADRSGIWGSTFYDMAKLAHSVLGFYDSIIANRYDLKLNSPTDIELRVYNCPDVHAIQAMFSEEIMGRFQIERREILAACVLLFLSMLPLHAEAPGRQHALLASGLKLYKEFEGL